MYALLAMLLVMAAFSFVSSAIYQEIRYPDLIELIDSTKYTDASQSQLEEGSEGKKIITIDAEKYELSRIRNVQVDKETVRGDVTVSKIVDGKLTAAKSRIFNRSKTTPKGPTKSSRRNSRHRRSLGATLLDRAC